MLPIETQRDAAFRFKTAVLGNLTWLEDSERCRKQNLIREMRKGVPFGNFSRASFTQCTLQKRFFASLLAHDVNTAEQAFEAYKSAVQAELDRMLFGDGEQMPYTIAHTDESFITHTGKDGVAVGYGKAIRDNVGSMQSALVTLKWLRTKCPMAI